MRDIFIGICAIIGYIVVIAAVLALPIWLLWNWLMPGIFGLPQINILQALGLSLLSGCLFGGKTSKSRDNDNTVTRI